MIVVVMVEIVVADDVVVAFDGTVASVVTSVDIDIASVAGTISLNVLIRVIPPAVEVSG